MFTHVMVGTNDIEISKKFYDAVLGALNIPPGVFGSETRCFYRSPIGSFAITKPINGEKATPANGGTIGFVAKSEEQLHAFHAIGTANGGAACEDPPGQRLGPLGPYFIAYLRDPDGNKICALYRPTNPQS